VKTILAILMVLALAGCNSATGLLSRDLDSLSVDLYRQRPSLVSGRLRTGIGAEDFLRAATMTGVCQIALGLPDERIDEGSGLDTLPVSYVLSTELEPRRVEAFQKGFYWIPSYEWAICSDTISVTASVQIVNLTGQEWLIPVNICDLDGEKLGGSYQPLIIGAGSRSLFWWTASTADTSIFLSFGWPTPGRWSALLAIPREEGGPIFEEPGEPWMEMARDTLWRTADDVLKVYQEMTVEGRGYSGILTIVNVSSWPVTAVERPAGGLLSGANVTLEGMADPLVLEPGETRHYDFRVGFPD
jgi:hypothetical protein